MGQVEHQHRHQRPQELQPVNHARDCLAPVNLPQFGQVMRVYFDGRVAPMMSAMSAGLGEQVVRRALCQPLPLPQLTE